MCAVPQKYKILFLKNTKQFFSKTQSDFCDIEKKLSLSSKELIL